MSLERAAHIERAAHMILDKVAPPPTRKKRAPEDYVWDARPPLPEATVREWCAAVKPKSWRSMGASHIHALTIYINTVPGSRSVNLAHDIPIRKQRRLSIEAIDTLIANLPSVIGGMRNSSIRDDDIDRVIGLLDAAHHARGIIRPVARAPPGPGAAWNTIAFMIYEFARRGWGHAGQKTVGIGDDSPAAKLIERVLDYLGKPQSLETISKALKTRRRR